MKTKIKFGIVVLVLMMGGFFFYRWKQKPMTYAGNIDATRVELPARLPTVVSQILVHEGDVVEKGQTLFNLSCEDLLISKKLIDKSFERSKNLFQSGSISKENFDTATNKRDEIETKISWCEVKSPISGVVLNRYLEPGEWANPGTKVVSVMDLDDVYAYVYLPQEMVANLKVGQKVQGKIPEMSDGTIEGVIRKINDEAEFTPKNVQTRSERTRLVYGVKVSLPNQERKLKPGMTIELEL